jgi:hypothetical protein
MWGKTHISGKARVYSNQKFNLVSQLW